MQGADYLKILTESRRELSRHLHSYAAKGVENSVVQKYSGQAHFIYELLQNADDAGATKARFVLTRKGLAFSHNGTRHFTISDPATEDEDDRSGKIGDINAITAIGGSNKNDHSTIGKFGIGFKAVFQYTSTPHIHDDNFHFKIENFVVPVSLEKDFPGRPKGQTLFVFPFNHKEKTADISYKEIKRKLGDLDYPVLFLTHLKEVKWEDERSEFIYKKSFLEEYAVNDIKIDIIELSHLSSSQMTAISREKLLLFTRQNPEGLPYCVGLFLNSDNKLKRSTKPAFCYFPTREETGLSFLIHAPFLLTDSRDNIRAGESHNNEMVELLANLAADSIGTLPYLEEMMGMKLITDDILDLLPYDPDSFEPENSPRRISFRPFYTKILEKFKNAAIIPSHKCYTDREHAIWADEPEIAALFSNEQLRDIYDDNEVAWAFPTRGRQNTIRNRQTPLRNFVDAITDDWLDEADILRSAIDATGEIRAGISAEFIEKQELGWLDKFYQWILRSKERRELIAYLPVFLDKDRKAAAIFKAENVRSLFLPDDVASDYPTVHPDLMKLESARNLLKLYDVNKPSLKDQVFSTILPKYDEKDVKINTAENFHIIFKYFLQCPQMDLPELIEALKEKSFLRYKKIGDEQPHRGKPEKIYYPGEDIEQWFGGKQGTRFIDVDFYHNLIREDEKAAFLKFMKAAGVNFSPMYIEHSYEYFYPWPTSQSWPTSRREQSWCEYSVDGIVDVLENIISNKNDRLSYLLWDYLLLWYSANKLIILFRGNYNYFYHKARYIPYESHLYNLLLENEWLLNKDGSFVSPRETSLEELDPDYLGHPESCHLCELLRIPRVREPEQDEPEVTTLEEFGARLKLTPEEQRQALEEFAATKRAAESRAEQADSTESASRNEDSTKDVLLNTAERLRKMDEKRARKDAKSSNNDKQNTFEDKVEADSDEFSPAPANLQQKIEKVKRNAEKEINAYSELEKLYGVVSGTRKYTWGWLKALLELESRENGTLTSGSREISIDFFKVEREVGSERTLILKQPSRPIPQMMEELTEIPLELEFSNGAQLKLPIEVCNVKSWTLRVKIKAGTELENIDFGDALVAHIEAQSPAFLFTALKNALERLAEDNGWKDDFDLQKNLPSKMEFIFGPPGTGKSTVIAKRTLEIIDASSQQNILILAPTNKAADVLVKRIISALPGNKPVPEWLVRFGVTGEEELEKKGILKPKDFPIKSLGKKVVITTIARYPYDYFLLDAQKRLFLQDMDWDYVILDEASMIHLPHILCPLFKSKPEKFLIAGDPHQIQPIAAVDSWKDENIYTLVRLNSFTKPATEPIQYPVVLLATQHRSLPQIGQIFSALAYDGALVHARSGEEPELPDNLSFPLEAINIIKFPVRKYESIYRSQRLDHGSPYHIYSALFAYEFVKYLAGLHWPRADSEIFRIGVIAPYRAQADIINKLVDGFKIPAGIDIQIGTIHGFQGDECEAIIAIFNPPPGISRSSNIFLNKLNIINVAISRARDYLFVLMPDDETEDVENLAIIKELERLCEEQGCRALDSQDVEEKILGSHTFLEDNSFATSHHDVNVYRKPERKYEIRCEAAAVDLQIQAGGNAGADAENRPAE